ncbi:MAG: immunoglobulin-like domain-containing protein [Bacteroidales bacterium]
MRKLLYTVLLVASCSVLFLGCNDDTKGLSDITYYANFDKKGDDVLFQNIREPFVEPGISASANDKELSIEISVAGEYTGYLGKELKTDVADYYNLSYTATNEDGYSSSEDRVVYVVETGDLKTNIAGLYTSTVVRNGSSGAEYTDMEYVLISKISDNKYILSCGIGAYYQLGRNYGFTYDAPVIITANNIQNNDFSSPEFGVGIFGGIAKIKMFTADPSKKTIHYITEWDSGYTFDVTLTQVEI